MPTGIWKSPKASEKRRQVAIDVYARKGTEHLRVSKNLSPEAREANRLKSVGLTHEVSEEARKRIAQARTSHGLSSTATYGVWTSMYDRCYRSNSTKYALYGGRGITICDRWLIKAGGSFENFLEDMGERPDRLTLDRIDSDGNYSPENCRWATWSEQRMNQRRMQIANA